MLQLNTKSNIGHQATLATSERERRNILAFITNVLQVLQKENVKPIGLILTPILSSVRPHIDRLDWMSPSCQSLVYITLHRLI